MAWVQAAKPKPPPKAKRPPAWVGAGPGTRPIGKAPAAPPIPPWAIGAPTPKNPVLTAPQQTAWAAGFVAPPAHNTGGSYNLETDPNVIAARMQEQLGQQQLDASLAAQRRQAIIRFGDPALATSALGLSAQDAAMAQENYLSGNATLAQLDKAHADRATAVTNMLAAHGILGSGDLGYRQGQENLQYGQSTYSARNSLLDYLDQAQSTYLDRQGSLRSATLAALQNAYQFALSNPQLYYGGDTTTGTTGGTPAAPGGTPPPRQIVGWKDLISGQISQTRVPGSSSVPVYA